MTSTILVAGATGSLGRAVCNELKSRGHRVRALGRNAKRLDALDVDECTVADALAGPDGLSAAVDGVDRVFSCLGASVMPSARGLYQTYDKVDRRGNLNLVEAAKRQGVDRFAYVSVALSEQMRGLQYADAHEAVVDGLRDSGLDYAIVRPTGFFSAFGGLLPFARKGRVPAIGDPSVRTNPIDERDLAVLCADATLQAHFGERTVGGPEVLSREAIMAAMFAALDKPTRLRRVPAGLVRFMSYLMVPFAPRLAHIVRFYAWVGEHDCIAEDSFGTRTIAQYFREQVSHA